MPMEDELAELSNAELYECIKVAFSQWQEVFRRGDDTRENRQIFYAYDRELLKRLNRVKKRL